MKRYLILMLCFLFLACQVQAGMIVQQFASGGSCESGSTDGTPVTSSEGGNGLYSGDSYGNTFEVTAAGTLYSITITLVGGGTSGGLTMRVDDDSDLSADTLVEKAMSGQSAGTVEFVFDTNPSLSTGTTYYWAVMDDQGGDTAYIRYDGGLDPDGRSVWDLTNGWDLTTDSNADRSFLETIKLCD